MENMDSRSSSSPASVGTLLQQLIRCLTKTSRKPHHLEPDLTDRDAQHQRLKRKAFETLFKHLNGPLSKKYTLEDEEQKGSVRSKEQLLQVVFELRRRRKFDEGHRLEQLIDSLPDLEDGKVKAACSLFLLVVQFLTRYSLILTTSYYDQIHRQKVDFSKF